MHDGGQPLVLAARVGRLGLRGQRHDGRLRAQLQQQVAGDVELLHARVGVGRVGVAVGVEDARQRAVALGDDVVPGVGGDAEQGGGFGPVAGDGHGAQRIAPGATARAGRGYPLLLGSLGASQSTNASADRVCM